ncbi:MFS transporter [Paenibacillus sp. MAHUQ-46]|uniref:MFS transporter n=2 Tax=Paenibacillus TaxID=44249 RepID=A0A934J4A3_9BACL|nr:MDR family MFS transporter [Paenibacillus roseus]MBJ6361399.1 MFS transporter [Paenibacillus roseus]
MVTAGLLAALFIGALDVTVVATAMPKITEELQGMSIMSWVFSIYTLTTCVTTPIFGKLTDLFGRKIVFLIGILLFVVGSILCGMAESMAALVLFRAVQGVGAGALNPVCFTIVGDIFPGEKRARMMGVFGSVWSVASLLGPLVGGYFVDQVDWRWIFWINVPIGIIALFLVVGFLHENFERKSKNIDYLGALTFTVALSALMYALLSGGEKYAWNSGFIIGLFAISAVLFLLFYWVEKRAAEPMMPLSIFKIRVLNVVNISGFLAFSVTTGMTIYAPIWIQSVLGHSATNSGLTVMPTSIAWTSVAFVVGAIMYRIGIKASVVFGSLLVLAASVWLVTMTVDSPYAFWVGIMIVFGLGMGFVATPQTVIVQSVVGWEMRGVANASNALMRSLGQTVGVAVFGTVFNQYVTTGAKVELVAGMNAVFILLAVIAAANLLSVLFLPSHSKVVAQQKSA